MPANDTEPAGTKIRHVRVPNRIWIKAATRAKADGANLSEIIRDLLRDYGNGHINP